MSFVGPRPIVNDEVHKYADRYQHLLQVMPGITGLWQVSGRNNTTYDERVDLDTYYVQNWSLWLDFYILACTVKVVLRRRGSLLVAGEACAALTLSPFAVIAGIPGS